MESLCALLCILLVPMTQLAVVTCSEMYRDSCLRCQLPDEYCHTCTSLHGNLPIEQTPQFITFTYTGGLTHDDWKVLVDVFDDDYVNMNGCPITITLFVVSDRSDNCSVHRMYYRGHEIALSGVNQTDYEEASWNSSMWQASIRDQRTYIHEASAVPFDHMIGMRAQHLIPGKDGQYATLQNLGLVYDSSLMSPPIRLDVLPWPYQLERSYHAEDPNCTTRTCPDESHDLIWEFPFIQLMSSDGDVCDYLDTCFSSQHKADDVQQVLRNYFNSVYHGSNRAPVQINIRHKTLRMGNVMKGLENFIRHDLLSRDDTWIVTFGDVLRWTQNPKSTALMQHEADQWGCSDYREYHECVAGRAKNSSAVNVNFLLVFDTSDLWIYQTVFLILLYIIVIRYDRKVLQHQHRQTRVDYSQYKMNSTISTNRQE